MASIAGIDKQLDLGMTDPQVQILQKFLNDQGYMVAAAGPGSKGQETTYFGPMTRAALMLFQRDLSEKGDETVPKPGSTGYGTLDTSTMKAIGGINPNVIPPPNNVGTKDQEGKVDYSNTGGSTSGTKTDTAIIDPTNPKDRTKTTMPESDVSKMLKQWFPKLDTTQITNLTKAITYVPGGSGNIDMPSILEPGTKEWYDAIDKIQSSAYDVANLAATADTQEQMAVAQYEWQKVQEDAKDKLGLSLSNNATEAWSQVQNLMETHAQRGLAGSGIEAETIDDYLAKVRRTDEQAREQAAADATDRDQTFYTNYASPEQIRELAQRDPEKAKKWGLIPDENIQKSLSYAALKAKYPDLTDEQIRNYQGATVDDTGSILLGKSKLYKNLAGTTIKNMQSQEEQAGLDLITKTEKAREIAAMPYNADKKDANTVFGKSGTQAASDAAASMGTGTTASSGPMTSLPSGATAQGNGIYIVPNPGSGAGSRKYKEVAQNVGSKDPLKPYTMTYEEIK